MSMRSRNYDPHPPACTCVDCVEQRRIRVMERLRSERNPQSTRPSITSSPNQDRRTSWSVGIGVSVLVIVLGILVVISIREDRETHESVITTYRTNSPAVGTTEQPPPMSIPTHFPTTIPTVSPLPTSTPKQIYDSALTITPTPTASLFTRIRQIITPVPTATLSPATIPVPMAIPKATITLTPTATPRPPATPRPTATPWPTPTTRPTPTPVSGKWIADLEYRIHQLVNEERRSNLRWDKELADIARRHSRDMASYGYFSHKDRNDRSPTDRGRAAGYTCRKDFGTYYNYGLAENISKTPLYSRETFRNGRSISKDYYSLEELSRLVVSGWMGSPGHRQNILNVQYDRQGIGIGVVHDKFIYITQNFC